MAAGDDAAVKQGAVLTYGLLAGGALLMAGGAYMLAKPGKKQQVEVKLSGVSLWGQGLMVSGSF